MNLEGAGHAASRLIIGRPSSTLLFIIRACREPIASSKELSRKLPMHLLVGMLFLDTLHELWMCLIFDVYRCKGIVVRGLSVAIVVFNEDK